MNQSLKIIDALSKILESMDVLQHGPEDLFDKVNLAEVHCIDWIGAIDDANVTKVAKEMGMTRGAISKISRKLLGKNLIESYQRSDNNKEIYFRLTEGGQSIYDDHKKRHSKVKEKELFLLETYSDNEQAIILRFLNDINCLVSELADEAKEE
jgi:DNA-binding MarR family transcriptional regulator